MLFRNVDHLISLAFTDLSQATSSVLKPCQGIFTAVQDTSSLAVQSAESPHADFVSACSGASALIMLITRADDPSQTHTQLSALLGAYPPGLQCPLLLLTTAPDLHQGVEHWLAALPDKMPGFRQHVSTARVVCLAAARAGQVERGYSQRALQAGLQWAAAHAPLQLAVRVRLWPCKVALIESTCPALWLLHRVSLACSRQTCCWLS